MRGAANAYSLSDKVIVITGSASGIGQALATQLLAEGASVIGIDLLAATVTHPRYTHITGDITEENIRAQAVKNGRVDVLINNAAVGIYAPSFEVTEAEMKRIYDVNVVAPIQLVSACMPHFKEQQSGMVVNVGSVCSKVSMPWANTYCSSKFALEGLTQGLRRELKSYNIHVMYAMPTVVETKFREHVLRGAPPAKLTKLKAVEPPERVAALIIAGMKRKRKNLYAPFMPGYPFAKMQEYTPWLMDWYLKSKQ